MSGQKKLFILFGVLFVFYLFFTPEDPMEKETIQNVNKNAAYTMAQSFVKDRLKSPSSAKWPWESSENVTEYLGNQTYVVKSYVDAKNAFGTEVRIKYYIKVKQADNNNWKLLDINIQE